ncbi:hypothetical protein Tco_0228704 [Tanacetum coccineum]
MDGVTNWFQHRCRLVLYSYVRCLVGKRVTRCVDFGNGLRYGIMEVYSNKNVRLMKCWGILAYLEHNGKYALHQGLDNDGLIMNVCGLDGSGSQKSTQAVDAGLKFCDQRKLRGKQTRQPKHTRWAAICGLHQYEGGSGACERACTGNVDKATKNEVDLITTEPIVHCGVVQVRYARLRELKYAPAKVAVFGGWL